MGLWVGRIRRKGGVNRKGDRERIRSSDGGGCDGIIRKGREIERI